MDEVEKQICEQKTQASDNVAVPGPMSDTASQHDDELSLRDTMELSEERKNLSWEDRLSMRPLRMSDFTLDELRQPFSKQCDHPPRRQSVAERLFRTKASNMAAHKKESAMDQATQDHNSNGNTSKVVKQAKKRSLADISFTSLMFNRRRGLHGRGA